MLLQNPQIEKLFIIILQHLSTTHCSSTPDVYVYSTYTLRLTMPDCEARIQCVSSQRKALLLYYTHMGSKNFSYGLLRISRAY